MGEVRCLLHPSRKFLEGMAASRQEGNNVQEGKARCLVV